MSQMSFSSLAYSEKKKVTRREQFLSEMDQVTPWAALEALIEPHYAKAGNGRRPMASGRDAAHLFHAAMVRFVRPRYGRRLV